MKPQRPSRLLLDLAVSLARDVLDNSYATTSGRETMRRTASRINRKVAIIRARRLAANNKTRRTRQSKAEWAHALHDRGTSTAEIALVLEIKTASVEKLLRRQPGESGYGSELDSAMITKALALASGGMKRDDIATHFNTTRNTIQRWLRVAKK